MKGYFTGFGDDGKTGLLGKGRVDKSDAVIETLGTLDELSASLGVARSLVTDQEIKGQILIIQRHVYEIMSEVASTLENRKEFHKICAETVTGLEKQIEYFSEGLIPPEGFIIPGDSIEEASISVARTITRRAERRVVELAEKKWVTNPELQRYLNRLSSLLFVMELKEIQRIPESKPTAAKVKPK